MSKRWLFAAVVVSAVCAMLITGCSGGKTTPSPTSSSLPPSSTTKSSAAASSGTSPTETTPVPTLDASKCADVSGANVDLLAATDKDAASKAAEILKGFDPPPSVRDAIDHFVNTGGAHFDDPDYTKNHKILDDWVKASCPS
jgi:hypothetical protein